MVGMIEKFDSRNLIDNVVTLGKVMVALPSFVASYLAVRPRLRGGQLEGLPPSKGFLVGVGTGALAGGLTIAAVSFTHVFPTGAVRRIFVSVSPTLLSILTWARGLPLAAVISILGGAALGAAGVGLRVLPDRYRRPLVTGLIATFTVAMLQRIIPQ